MARGEPATTVTHQAECSEQTSPQITSLMPHAQAAGPAAASPQLVGRMVLRPARTDVGHVAAVPRRHGAVVGEIGVLDEGINGAARRVAPAAPGEAVDLPVLLTGDLLGLATGLVVLRLATRLGVPRGITEVCPTAATARAPQAPGRRRQPCQGGQRAQETPKPTTRPSAIDALAATWTLAQSGAVHGEAAQRCSSFPPLLTDGRPSRARKRQWLTERTSPYW